jgi:short-subunit dehydrogenase
MQNNHVLIFGAGSIGSALASQLCSQGRKVIVATKSAADLEHLQRVCALKNPHASRYLRLHQVDVLNHHSLTRLEKEIRVLQSHTNTQINAIIYAIGACPPGGFSREVSTPLHEISSHKMEQDFQLYVTGFMNVGRHFLRHIQDRGHIIALSSAVTRLTPETCPPWLHAWHYIAIKAALDKIILGYRHSPLVRQKKLLVHRIAPSAVDTPFHTCSNSHQVLKMLPVKQVVDEIEKALQSHAPVDKEMVAS